MRRPPFLVDLGPARARARAAWERGNETPGEAGLTWLERAHRLAPADQNVLFSLAARRLGLGQYDRAAKLFEAMAERFGVPECWAGLAACRLATGEYEAAACALAQALSQTEADVNLAELAARATSLTGRAGWCGLSLDGVLLTNLNQASLTLRLDEVQVVAAAGHAGQICLPPGWKSAQRLHVEMAGQALLGSPLSVAAILRLEGFAERLGTRVSGTAWYPAAPLRDPELRVIGAGGQELCRFLAQMPQTEIDGTSPLSRQRVFACDVPRSETVRIVGGDGRDLLGSPLPFLVHATAKRTKRIRPLRRPAPELAVDVVIPVYRGLQTTLDCIGSVLETVAPPHRVLVVDDASPEPALVAALRTLADQGRIKLLGTGPPGAPNRGFPAAVNVGLCAAVGRHVIVLNSDTLVAPGWLEALRAACCSASDIGTATPLSNEASIFSYPKREGGNAAPDLAATRVLAAAAARANAGVTIDVPTAHGFCMFIRADCLAETGLFDATSFAQGYGEENDFTERARSLGWRHVAAPGVFVAHHGGVSFGGARAQLLRRNLAILQARYPAYRSRVDAFIEADALAAARTRLDAERWSARETHGDPVLLITHGVGGGTARVVAERARFHRAEGRTPIVLSDVDGLCEVGEPGGIYPNLLFDLPHELPHLIHLLQAPRPVAAELHHLLGHDHSILQVLSTLAIPYDVWVHDYAWFCARVSFVTGEGRFCGEADSATCETCIALWDRRIEDPIAPADLRRRSAADLLGARAIIVPSHDVARRVARHVPGATAKIQPWEQDPSPAPARVMPRSGKLHVAVIGAIGPDKGYSVLLDCAQDAARRNLDLRFTVIGYTVDDDALLATERVFITGEFRREEAADLIRSQNAHVAFLPSIWPETWCYALTDVWNAGLCAAVFDIGTPADRVRSVGRGWVLPLGLPAERVNDVLLNLA